MTLKIALGCEMRVGKDLCATLFEKNLKERGEECVKLSFAKPLYDIMYYAQDLCNIPRYKDRKFLQLIGTEWAREKDPNIWVNCMKKEVEGNPSKHIIVTDLRFKNEFEFCRDNGFLNIRIVRDKALRDEQLNVQKILPQFLNPCNKPQDSRTISACALGKEALRETIQEIYCHYDNMFDYFTKDKLDRLLTYAQMTCGFPIEYDEDFYTLFKNIIMKKVKWNSTSHISETQLTESEFSPLWNYVMPNHTTISDLEVQVDTVVNMTLNWPRIHMTNASITNIYTILNLPQ